MPVPDSPFERRQPAPTPRRGAPRREHLYRRSARFLDPGSALRFESQQLSPTAYAGDQLLLRPSSDDKAVVDALRKAADAEEYDLEIDDRDQRVLDLARREGIDLDADQPLIVRVHFNRRYGGRPQPPPDVWPILQRFRVEMAGHDREHAVQLEHLLTTAAGLRPAAYEPTPYVHHPYVHHPYVHHPYVHHGAADPYAPDLPSPTAEYAQPGWGGRMPVTWLGPRPVRRTDAELDGARRPVVAVLDSGCGTHPWLTDDIVDRSPTVGKIPIGLTDPDTDIERLGIITGKLTGSLDVEAGHGTFIAGLIHQRCPDARILSIRVTQPDGVVNEYDVLQALNLLWLRQEIALRRGWREHLIDVISMSLGYYHEVPADALYDPLLLAPLQALGRQGVAVVTSAGNDATDRPLYPAAFAPYDEGVVTRTEPDVVPVVAVGAINPDGSVALFSNDGPWVRAYRPGAGLISTVPTSFDGGRAPTVQLVEGGEVRATIDPDNFRSGFAAWSGTSFAAPVLAGDVAQILNEVERLRADPSETEDAVTNVRRALGRAVPELAPELVGTESVPGPADEPAPQIEGDLLEEIGIEEAR